MLTQKKQNAFLIWLLYFKRWPGHVFGVLFCVILSLPFAFCLLSLIPYILKSVGGQVDFISWTGLFGPLVGGFLQPYFQHTFLATGFSATWQKERLWELLLIAGIIYGLCDFLGDYCLRHLGEQFAFLIRSRIAKKYFSFPYEQARHLNVGLLSSMVGEDTKEAHQTFTRIITSICKDCVFILLFTTWLALLDSKLFILFCVIMIPAGIILRITTKILKRLSQQGLKYESDLMSAMLERMKGWQTIQVYKAIPFEMEKFHSINERIFHTWRRATRAKSLGSPLVEWLAVIAIAVLILNALHQISAHQLSTQTFVSFVLTLGFLSDKLNRLSIQISSTRKGTDALLRMEQFLNIQEQPFSIWNEHLQKQEEPPFLSSIVLQNVSFSYANMRPIQNLCLELHRGQIALIVGPSGVGKSTLLRILLGLFPIQSGKIQWNQQDISEELLRNFASVIGFLPQEPFLIEGSIFDNLIYPHTQFCKESAQKALKLALLDKPLDLPVSGLSGGEKQRLMFARVFCHHPQCVFMDESTSALDTLTEQLLMENYKKYVAGKTITWVVAHRPQLLQYADIVLNLNL